MPWILPTILSLLSVAFLILRGFISGKHINPTSSPVSETLLPQYDLSRYSDNIVSLTIYLVNRFYDFVYYFIISSDKINYYATDQFSNFSGFGFLGFSLLAILILTAFWKHIDKKCLITATVILISLFIPYLLTLQPMTPTRHSLVLFLPISLIASLILSKILKKFLLSSFDFKIQYVILMFVSFYALGFNSYRAPTLNIPEFIEKSEELRIDELVLAPCHIRAMLYPRLRDTHGVLYRCGPRVIEKLKNATNRVAVLSEIPMVSKKAMDIIKDFSNEAWVPTRTIGTLCEGSQSVTKNCLSNIFILEKLDTS